MKPGWRYAKAAVTGTRHAADRRGCEDFAAARIIGTARGNVLAACVCDGAGSSPQAATGARVAAEAFLTVAGDRLRDAGGPVEVARRYDEGTSIRRNRPTEALVDIAGWLTRDASARAP